MKSNNKKQIIFLEPFPEVMFYKMARLFKKKDYETISIRLLETKDSDYFYRDAFSEIISFNLKFFKINIKNIPFIIISLFKNMKNFIKAGISISKLKPYVIISRAGPSWPCALTRVLFRKIPLIYFPYDIRSQGYKTEKSRKKRGIPKFEMKAERFCFENTDGIIHKGHPDELKFLEGGMLGKNLKLTLLQLNFHPYTSKEFMVSLNKNKLSKRDKEIHLVHLNSVGAVNLKFMSFIYDELRLILKHKIHVHMYSKLNNLSKEEFFKSFKEDFNFIKEYKDVLKSKYFHLYPPLTPKDIIPETSKYDYGILPVPKGKDSPDLKFATGNKLATYLEAGIPILCGCEAESFEYRLVEDYGIGIRYDNKILKNLRNVLKKLDYKKLEKNIIKAREDYNMEKYFSILEKFIERVVVEKKSQQSL